MNAKETLRDKIRPGFVFWIGKRRATISDEDEFTFGFILGGRFRSINKPAFFQRIGKSEAGRYYLSAT